MTEKSITVYRTYKYRLYKSNQSRHLHDQINIAGLIWNHALALRKRYYRRFRSYISSKRLKNHIAYLRMKTSLYPAWKLLNAQSVQAVIERLDLAYQRFFDKQGGLPHFKKVKRYSSFVLKQSSWKLLSHNRNQIKPNGKYGRAQGSIEIEGKIYPFVQHRPMNGIVKTITVKRDKANQLWLCFSVTENIKSQKRVSTGQIGGMDFGLRTFLTDEQGRAWLMPEFFKQNLVTIRHLSRNLARKVEGSNHHKYAHYQLAKAHIKLANKRRDYHFKLARALCKEYDVLVMETLNIRAMRSLWGRKISDLGFSLFKAILKHIARLESVAIVEIDRFEPTTQTCSCCGNRQKMALKERLFTCVACKLVLNRDHNAALNIQRVGASTLGIGAIRLPSGCNPA